jgi:hypothetical protein
MGRGTYQGGIRKTSTVGCSKDYVRFDDIEDVLASADLMALVAPIIKKKPSYWKWMILATHDALQGAMVCALMDSTGTAVLEGESGRKMLAWLERRNGDRGKAPKEMLAGFGVLLERCTTRRPNFEPLVLAEGQLKAIKRLHREFRNNFAHFTAKGWSIEKEGLPRIVGAAIDATEWLMSQDQVTYRMSGNGLRRLKGNLKVARAALRNEKLD